MRADVEHGDHRNGLVVAPVGHRAVASCRTAVPAAATAALAGSSWVVRGGLTSRLDAAAASATAAASSRLVRSPCRNVASLASRAPKTATAKAPPTWRLVLNTPLAVPARCPGTLLSNTAVTGGMTRGPASPTRAISTASAHTGVQAG